MSHQEVSDAIERLGKAHEAYKETNNQRLKAIEEGRESDVKELGAKLEKIDSELTKVTEIKDRIEVLAEHDKEHRDRIEELEADRSGPSKTSIEERDDRHLKAWLKWARKGTQHAEAEHELKSIETEARNELKVLAEKGEVKAANVLSGTDAAGGFAVPTVIAREIEKLELLFSPVRRIVKRVTTNTPQYSELVNIRGATAGWVGESGSRTQTATPELREQTPTFGELYAYPETSEWALDDIFFDVENWLASEVADQFAQTESQAVIDGSGTNRPTGMLDTTPVLTDDDASPLRAANAYEYISSDPGSPAVPQILADSLITTIYALNSAYRPGSTWVMNSSTTADIRKLTDANNQYLWQPGLQAGQPSMLLGYPVETWEQMPDVGAGNHPVAFGNFRRGYLLVDRVGLRSTRDNVTNPGFVRFYIRRREGGIPLNNNAIKFIRTEG